MSTAVSPQPRVVTDTPVNAAHADVVLQFQRVSKRYKTRSGSAAQDAVSQVDLSVQRGEVLCLMGTSGSGKSTLLRHINRLIEPSDGTVLLDGADISQLSATALRDVRSRRIGMVFQHFGLLPHRSVRDNVALPLELRGEAEHLRRAAADEQLRAVGLDGWGDHFPAELSGGMQQRVGLVRALIGEPDILLMDEPFSALDPTIRRDLQTHFLQLVKARGITTLLVTHDPGEALRLGDRIAVLRAGRLIQVATPEGILHAPADAEVADFFRDEKAINATAQIKPLSAKQPTASVSHTSAPTSMTRGPALLLGPAAFDATRRAGLFWTLLIAELAALAALGQGILSGHGWPMFAGAAVLVFSRAAATLWGPGSNPRAWLGLPLAVQTLSQALVLWRAVASDASGPWVQFPAQRSWMLATAEGIDSIIGWSQSTFETSFVGVIFTVRTVIEGIENVLAWLPWPVAALALVFLAWRAAGTALALTAAGAVAYIGLFGFWERTLSTFALVGSSVLIVLAIGVPLGILVAKRPLAQQVITPILDVMQTLPTFVYLIPAVAFFSVGKTPAVIATVIFALAPMIRLTALGIHEVPKNTVEAAVAHGATPWQTLTKVELPLASGSLLLGINQTLVMSLSMVVVAALIGAGGLGYDVMTALRNIKGGEGLLAGAAIVFCALIPDRIIQSTLRKRSRSFHRS
ncbi:ATP-binding cassette domain-containing protein [Pseudomonas sp. GD03842]|uniref:ATP-binding cassette domain-containing protein n=1 Tax=Pseudomonas sp. GD03842 TaxID=2975385 RepID=UPI002448B48C|nr:ATP-binding cassette domain-containing protein [Pseudomonas sp. GD03842]MDH0747844.1 ATP-binding cassette domain-containing protein [Pseudomonas sp. GD03842]